MKEADQITRDAVAKLKRTPATREAELRLIWSRVVDALAAIATARGWQMSDTHDAVDLARSAFLAAWMRGEPDDTLEMHALGRVKTWNPTIRTAAPVLPIPAPILPPPQPKQITFTLPPPQAPVTAPNQRTATPAPVLPPPRLD